MKILNVEDNAYKHHDICKVLDDCGIGEGDIAWFTNLEEGLDAIHRRNEAGMPFDLIITDMWYPLVPGGHETKAGERLIDTLIAEGIQTPVIICSSANCSGYAVLGAVHYSPFSDWETDLERLVQRVKMK